MISDQNRTGTRNSQYDLLSVLYRALEQSASFDKYIVDARGDDDTEFANFFEAIKQQNSEQAERAKELLRSRL